MAYLIQQTVPFSIEIDGVDYTEEFVEFAITDTSAFMTGTVIATGTIVLGTPYTGDADASAFYRAPRFKRGALIKVRVQYPDGTIDIHPRGWLYVLQSSYNPNSETTVLEVGDQIALRRLTDEVSPIIAMAPITLEPAQQTFEGAAGAFAAKGQYLWQDNTGKLRVSGVTDASRGTIEIGEWVSVRSVTALSVAPLSGSDTPPDKVEVEYETPADDGNDTDTETESGEPIVDIVGEDEDLFTASDNIEDDFSIEARTDTTSVESYYFVNYPATAFVRVPDNPNQSISDKGELGDLRINAAETNLQEVTACGPPPEKPEGLPESTAEDEGDSYTQTCEDGYTTIKTPFYIPTKRTSTSKAQYYGPGGQLTVQTTTETAAAFEVNAGYYADKFDFCRRVYRNPCLPEGNCQREGMEQITASKTVSTNYYGKGGQVIRSVTDRFIPLLAAAISDNYRFTTASDGESEFFDNDFGDLTKDQLFRASRVERVYSVVNGANVEEVTTFTSSVSRGGGVGRQGKRPRIDALDGIITKQTTSSYSTSTLALTPPTNGSAQKTKKKGKNVSYFPGVPQIPGLVNPPQPQDPLPTGEFEFTKKIAPPVPFLDGEDKEAKDNADYYAYVYMRSVWGDANGLTIVEYQRKDMDEGWYPTRPFVYYDDVHDKIVILRMDAASWAMGPDSSAVNINGNYVCEATGAVTIPHNLMGDAIPNLEGGLPTPPALEGDGSTGSPEYPTASVEPTGVTYTYEVDVEISFIPDTLVYCRGGVCPVLPGDTDGSVATTFMVYCYGTITAPGNLLTPGPNGGMPISSLNTLVTDVNQIINPDLFAPAE